MKTELVLICAFALLAIVSATLVFAHVRFRARTVVGGIVASWLTLVALMVSAQCFWTSPSVSSELAVTNRPIQAPVDGYVGSAACQSCHPHSHATWHDSYHRTMTQVASEKSVFGNFDDVRLDGKDFSVHLRREGKQFVVEMSGAKPNFHGVFPVVMTTGSHNRQVYWLAASDDSRLIILPYMYLKAEKRWIPRHSAYINAMCLEDRPELAVLKADHGRWSQVCIKCHTTHGRSEPISAPGDPIAKWGGAQVAEFGISCEACHGPGAEHVRVNRNPLRRYQHRLGDGQDTSIVNPARLPHDRSSQVCGQCHAVIIHRDKAADIRWKHEGNSYRPGNDLLADPIRFVMRGRLEQMPADRPKDWPDPSELGSFWSDGMSRATGREFNNLLDTPCYQRGTMSCMSCHEMHQSRGDPRPRHEWADGQLKLGMDGNRACVQCHPRFENADQLAQHTHHAADSSGSLCYNCHMPKTTYGLLKATRSHQVNSPTVTESLETGRPNACNQCHLDKTLAWTSEHLHRRYKTPRPKLSKDEQEIAASVLWTLKGDAGQRAIMAWTFGWNEALATSGRHWQAPYLAQLLDDRYDAVRFIAHRSLRRLPGLERFDYDFVGAPEHRAEAHRQAKQLWQRWQKGHKLDFPQAVLIDPRGQLHESAFQRLWKLRDDRPMAVNE